VFKDYKNKPERNKLIFKAFKEHGYTQTEIGDHLDIQYSVVSRIIGKIKKSKNKT